MSCSWRRDTNFETTQPNRIRPAIAFEHGEHARGAGRHDVAVADRRRRDRAEVERPRASLAGRRQRGSAARRSARSAATSRAASTPRRPATTISSHSPNSSTDGPIGERVDEARRQARGTEAPTLARAGSGSLRRRTTTGSGRGAGVDRSTGGSCSSHSASPPAIVADVGVAELVKQAHGLRAERSGRAPAVGDDRRVAIAEHVAGAVRDVGDRQVDRAGNVHRRERLRREHVDQRDAAVAKRANQLVAR